MPDVPAVPAEEAVANLGTAVGSFIGALAQCREAGIPPAEALQAIGFEIPSFAAPMVNMQLNEMVDTALAAAEESSTEGVAS